MHFPPVSAFGLGLEPDFALPARCADASPGLPTARVLLRDWGEVEGAGADCADVVWRTVFDDRPFEVRSAPDGRHQFEYGENGRFHLSADAQTLTCAALDPADAGWQRLLMDTILWSAGSLSGRSLLHCSAVSTERGLAAILAPSGGGKTSLSAELVHRGFALATDDVLAFEPRSGEVIGFPGPAAMNLPSTAGASADDPFGPVLGDFPGEDWVGVGRHEGRPRPLVALCLLDRHSGEAEPRAEWTAVTALDLLPYAFGLSITPERYRRVFNEVSDVAEAVPALRLVADRAAPASRLADVLLEALAGAAGRPRVLA